MARNVRGVAKVSPGLRVVVAGMRTAASTLPAFVVRTGSEMTNGNVSMWPMASPTWRDQKATTGIPPPTWPRSSLTGTGAPKGFSSAYLARTGKISSLPHFKLAPSKLHSGGPADEASGETNLCRCSVTLSRGISLSEVLRNVAERSASWGNASYTSRVIASSRSTPEIRPFTLISLPRAPNLPAGSSTSACAKSSCKPGYSLLPTETDWPAPAESASRDDELPLSSREALSVASGLRINLAVGLVTVMPSGPVVTTTTDFAGGADSAVLASCAFRQLVTAKQVIATGSR